MGGLQGIVAVCSRSAFTLRGVSGGADAQLCLFSLASLAPVQTLSSLHKKRRRRRWDGRADGAQHVAAVERRAAAITPHRGRPRFEKHKMLDRGKRSLVGVLGLPVSPLLDLES